MKNFISHRLIALLFGIIAFATSVVYAQVDNWVTIKAGDMSVLFPSKPEERTMPNGQQTYRLKIADSTAIFGVIVNDLSSRGVSAAQYAELVKTSDFWNSVKSGYLNSVKDAKIVKDEIGTYNNTPFLAMEIVRGKDVLYQRIFIIGTKNYGVSFTSKNGQGDLKIRDSFFSSVKF